MDQHHSHDRRSFLRRYVMNIRGLAVAAGVISMAAAGISIVHAATAPGCVNVQNTSSGNTYRVRVTNKCGSTQRVKVIWAWAPDSSCVSLQSNYYFDDTGCSGKACSIPPKPRFDRLESC